MILSKKVIVKRSSYYKGFGYDISEKYIEVDINIVPIGSRCIVEVECDYCLRIREISYKDYNSNIIKGNKYSCSVKCGTLKSRENCLEKWGVDSFNKLETTKDKRRNTVREKYGVDHISKLDSVSESKSIKMKSKSKEISERVKKYYSSIDDEIKSEINKKRETTNLEKWGVDNISKNDLIKEKKKDSFSKKWGGFTLESEILIAKFKETNNTRYGFEYPSSSQTIKDKIINTNLEKWGFKYPSMSDEIKNKTKDTLLSKYNVINIMFSEEFRKKFNISNEIGYIRYIGNRIYEFKCSDCNKLYNIDYDNYYKRSLRNVKTCTKCFPILENSSIKECELRDFIKRVYSGEVVTSYRDGLEIDIYLPDLKIGFEFNGIFWHSEDRLDRNYHLNKTNYFKDKGIRIIHIWEDDWDYKKDIIKSQISSWIGVTFDKIWARKCVIKQIDDIKLYKRFLDENHIQGFIRSTIKIGLFYNDELVSLMTFDNLEGRKKMEDNGWNLSRFCSKKNTNVVGAASKLFKYFIKTYKPTRVISFSDKDWSLGDIYIRLGFNIVKDLKPDFKYIIDKKRINKQRLTKKKLTKLGYNSDITADRIIEDKGITKVYNVGQLKFEKK